MKVKISYIMRVERVVEMTPKNIVISERTLLTLSTIRLKQKIKKFALMAKKTKVNFQTSSLEKGKIK